MNARALAAALLGASALAALAIAAVRQGGPEPAADPGAELYAQFCTPVPAAAVVADSLAADHRVDVRVPPITGAPGLDDDLHATRAARDDVIEIRITAPMAGAASVHGLSDLVVMKPGEPVTLRFRAIYSGRFPLHFHGADGSHYGVWALNITTKGRT